jgi:hypothetical protein
MTELAVIWLSRAGTACMTCLCHGLTDRFPFFTSLRLRFGRRLRGGNLQQSFRLRLEAD